jgi:very-short-patch-repair endonuclease
VSFPELVGHSLGAVVPQLSRLGHLNAWLRQVCIEVADVAKPFLARCESGVEVWLAAQFVARAEVTIDGDLATDGRTQLRLQHPCRTYRIDLVATRGECRLAIEVDGWEWHQRSEAQVQSDYLRERRLTLDGYCVVRFTAREVYSNPAECWRQIDAILAAWEARS